jgi:hypothetical protein
VVESGSECVPSTCCSRRSVDMSIIVHISPSYQVVIPVNMVPRAPWKMSLTKPENVAGRSTGGDRPALERGSRDAKKVEDEECR